MLAIDVLLLLLLAALTLTGNFQIIDGYVSMERL